MASEEARNAAARFVEAVKGEGYRLGHHHIYRAGKADDAALVQSFEAFRAQIVAGERERAAGIVLQRTPVGPYAKHSVYVLVNEIAAAIRKGDDHAA